MPHLFCSPLFLSCSNARSLWCLLCFGPAFCRPRTISVSYTHPVPCTQVLGGAVQVSCTTIESEARHRQDWSGDITTRTQSRLRYSHLCNALRRNKVKFCVLQVYDNARVVMLAAFWSHEYVRSSDLTSVGSKVTQ